MLIDKIILQQTLKMKGFFSESTKTEFDDFEESKPLISIFPFEAGERWLSCESGSIN